MLEAQEGFGKYSPIQQGLSAWHVPGTLTGSGRSKAMRPGPCPPGSS